MTRNARIRMALALVALLPFVAACDGDPTRPDARPSMERIAGTYGAHGSFGAFQLITTQDGQTTDWLALGGAVELRLEADGATSGRVRIPGGDEDGGDWEADLSGTWSLEGDTVRFAHEADTFIRDMPFAVVGRTLVGDRSFGGGVRIRMVLRRE